jgi:hypothetical protein
LGSIDPGSNPGSPTIILFVLVSSSDFDERFFRMGEYIIYGEKPWKVV